ncbi:Alkaline phosphatase synthesis transcriptional regulatory protein PhoP [bacterium HR11]|nr:Alkaline phosphatase synthesis transcriptional regulatory protein PhoP [bacterium HR11]
MQRIKVLLADRSTTIQRIVKLTLEGEPIEVIVASTGREALEKIRSEHPDVILADTRLSEIDGFQICETLRKNPDWILMADTPVLLMTGIYDTMEGRREEIEQRLRAVGADGLIVKPFDPKELVQRIMELARQRPRLFEEEEGLPETPVAGAVEATLEELEQVMGGPEVPSPARSDLEERTVLLSPEERDLLLGLEAESVVQPTEVPASEISPEELEAPSPAEGPSPSRYEPPTQPGAPVFESAVAPAGPGVQVSEEAIFLIEEAAPPPVPTPLPKEEEAPFLVWEETPTEVAAPAAEWGVGEAEGLPAETAILQTAEPLGEQIATALAAEVPLEEEVEEPILLEAASEVVEPLVPPAYEEAPVPPPGLPEAPGAGWTPEPTARPVAVDPAEVARRIVQDPEFIQRVAERVVQHLSRTTLEDIAWQVVPELAEQLIQKRLKEKGL